MSFWYEKAFAGNTQYDNYETILQMILSQMETDGSDYMDPEYRHQGIYIQYYLDNLDKTYKEKVLEHISLEVLKTYILDRPVGFGKGDDSEEDRILFHKIRQSIFDELYPYDYYEYSMPPVGCRVCGCSAEKDDVGDRICFCDACMTEGCHIIK